MSATQDEYNPNDKMEEPKKLELKNNTAQRAASQYVNSGVAKFMETLNLTKESPCYHGFSKEMYQTGLIYYAVEEYGGQKPWDHFDCDPQIPASWPDNPTDMLRFDMLKCAPEAKRVVIGRYPPDKNTGERPKILGDKWGKKSQHQELAESVISMGRLHENGLMALAGVRKGAQDNPIEVDKLYTFTFQRGIYTTSFPTDDKKQKMGELMIEAQKDRSSGVFNFTDEEISGLCSNELRLIFVPKNTSVKDKQISYTLGNFNKMTVLQFSKSVKDTNIIIAIEL
eukprot:CAMPEP_0194341358 /NCGR_PEP_ID=MMETSP0171-20130528/89446_1 /TAXON_ID=218684 /ORGANISM="Corethron pennatum, Strain L29A3" /LENGTH=282 /DNA_ID=CAMNT_0039106673 /DNA_START=40 /DNA_END=884 /DNA_ORIENTATION=+